ncbi:MAG: potassium transporter Kup [Sterolibacterium sp.]|nr:potassium transporter Kup [Sterolibacterium sp.]
MDTSHADKKQLASLSLAALGVAFGDIGTSPLYTMKEVFAGTHHPVPVTPENVLGILSLIFWSLMVVITIKYIYFILRADNKGEGGIMALMALALRNKKEGTHSRLMITMLGLFGASLFYGDGVVTPAISVLSAVEGLEVISPAFHAYIIPTTLAVLVALFAIQSRGTASVGRLFGPVMTLWFITLAMLGIINIIAEPRVIQAINPYYAIAFLLDHPLLSFLSLGAVVLALTGAEALYADMGHFGRKPIQMAWLFLALPALVCNYFGQGALILSDPEAIKNPFYLLAPHWALYPLIALATLSTVIASQAVISGAYSVTRQAMQLGYCPRLEVQHTSDHTIGQIYLPSINWMLLILVILLVIGFGSSTKLAAAYGIAVTGTMLITSILAYYVAREIWGWPAWRAFLGALPFVCIDLAYFSACSVKIIDGGWFPLVFGMMLFLLLTTWKRGRALLQKRLSDDAIGLEPFIRSVGIDDSITRVPGTAIFMTSNLKGVPHAMLHSLKHYKVLHERVVLLAVSVLDIPHVADAQHVSVENLPNQFWRVKVFYGFMDEPNLPEALDWCAEQGLDFDMMDTSFFLGRETLIARFGSEMNYWRQKVFITMFRNASSVASFFKLPANRVVEMGTQVEL